MSSVRIEQRIIDDVFIFILHLENAPNGSGGYENTLNDKFIVDFQKALDEVEKISNGNAACVITVGKGKHYSNGLDLTHVLSLDSMEQKIGFLKQVELLYFRILTFPMPTIAAINGHAFAGGMLLALAHDYRISNSEKGFWCMTEIDIPAPLTPGMRELFNSKVPLTIGSHMMLTAARLNATEMKTHGIVWETAKGEDEVLNASLKLGAKVGVKAKPVMREIKEDLWYQAGKQLRDGSALRAKF